MSGFFGVVSRTDCVAELFYGTDYHSHLGTKRGGLCLLNGTDFSRSIHNIENAQFRSKFADELPGLHGNRGIGVISDNEDQPLIIGSHLGVYGIVTVGAIQNVESLAAMAFGRKTTHFAEMSGGQINPTELTAALINQEGSFVEGIARAQELIDGSCSILLLTRDGIYAARDRLGRVPVVIGARDGARAATLETCALPNLQYETQRFLGPGEVVRLTDNAVEQLRPPGERMQICTFLWVYYGYPASSYEGINVEAVRYRCGEALAAGEDASIDLAAGIPDSGTAHAIGFANAASVPFCRPFVKYTPTWPRSFMPPDQRTRDLVGRMKLIPIREMIEGKRLLFCEDSIVRGTQLRATIRRLFDFGAKEVHMRPACPPLVYSCPYLNFSRSRSELDLAARRAIARIEGDPQADPAEYTDPSSEKHHRMVEQVREGLNLTSLRYQKLDDLVAAVGLPKEKLCTYCWDGCSGCE